MLRCLPIDRISLQIDPKANVTGRLCLTSSLGCQMEVASLPDQKDNGTSIDYA